MSRAIFKVVINVVQLAEANDVVSNCGAGCGVVEIGFFSLDMAENPMKAAPKDEDDLFILLLRLADGVLNVRGADRCVAW